MRLYTMEDGIYINIPNNMVNEINKYNIIINLNAKSKGYL